MYVPAMSKSPKQLTNNTEKSRNQHSSSRFQECLSSHQHFSVTISYS